MGCFVVAEFLLTIASRGPSAIAELLVLGLGGSIIKLQYVNSRSIALRKAKNKKL